MLEKKIFGIVGPSGVGKGYVKNALLNAFPMEFVEPVVVTTRKRRPSDGSDRLNVDTQKFNILLNNHEVIFEHQPYGADGAWYGFLSSSLNIVDKHILTEVHVENIPRFKNEYHERLFLLGLIAQEEYLRVNLVGRGESEREQDLRLSTAIGEVKSITDFYDGGLVDEILTVNNETREIMDQLTVSIAIARLSLIK